MTQRHDFLSRIYGIQTNVRGGDNNPNSHKAELYNTIFKYAVLKKKTTMIKESTTGNSPVFSSQWAEWERRTASGTNILLIR